MYLDYRGDMVRDFLDRVMCIKMGNLGQYYKKMTNLDKNDRTESRKTGIMEWWNIGMMGLQKNGIR